MYSNVDLNNVDQIVGYIAGNVVRYLVKTIQCDACVNSLLAQAVFSQTN